MSLTTQLRRKDQVQKLNDFLSSLSGDSFDDLVLDVGNENPWFTKQSIKKSLSGILHMISGSYIDQWLKNYNLSKNSPKNIGLILAGNIPLVGFHDIISVYLSGHFSKIKLSHQDTILTKAIVDILNEIEGKSKPIEIVDRLNNIDAVIATGSTNTSRYFEYYFGKYPHIIRKNRTSIGILSGNEDETKLSNLGEDIFSYFGFGCRNVSFLMFPKGYVIEDLPKYWSAESNVINHHKYANNYDYQKSVLLINREEHLDLGYLLLKKSDQLHSPLSVLHYDFYESQKDLDDFIETNKNKIQCVAGKEVQFGATQSPGLSDYADGIDTMKFLSGL